MTNPKCPTCGAKLKVVKAPTAPRQPDEIDAFLEEARWSLGEVIEKVLLYRAYCHWCADKGERTKSRMLFERQLRVRGLAVNEGERMRLTLPNIATKD